MKLKHISGYLDCDIDGPDNSRSRWGCWDYLLTLITDNQNNIVFPDPKIVTSNAYHRYKGRGWNSRTSTNLTFVDMDKPMYVERGMELRVWYGEDLVGHTEADNGGKHCVDVYAQIVDQLIK